MTEDNAKNKLTLSGKSTLTLKGLGDAARSHNRDGKKVVQVEVRKKRIITPNATKTESKVEIDEATANKLRLIAEAKEFEQKRRQEEEEKSLMRQKQKEQEEAERKRREEEAKAKAEAEARKAKEEVAAAAAQQPEADNRILNKLKDKKSKMILQIHDELIIDTARDELDEVMMLLTEEMQNAYELKVPLIAKAGFAEDWGSLK